MAAAGVTGSAPPSRSVKSYGKDGPEVGDELVGGAAPTPASNMSR
jgi:hypothetical protein